MVAACVGWQTGTLTESLQRALPRSTAGRYSSSAATLKAGFNFDWSGPRTEGLLLSNVALRSQLRNDLTRKKLSWDSEKMTFTNHDSANQFSRRECREGR